MTETFEPRTHLTRIKGQDYLEVKWRIAWLRTEHPDAVIETELVSHDGRQAIFRAAVNLPNGGRATGYGSETAEVFENYIEKAETKAIGRALAALGFGTQFCQDFSDADTPADAPVQPMRPTVVPSSTSAPTPLPDVMTGPQRNKIAFLAGTLQLSREQLQDVIKTVSGTSIDGLTKRDASRVIDALNQRNQAGPESRAS